jgi:hypothetical protein
LTVALLACVCACASGPKPAAPARGPGCTDYAFALGDELAKIGVAMDRFADRMSSDPDDSAKAADELSYAFAESSIRLDRLQVTGDALARANHNLAGAALVVSTTMHALAGGIREGKTEAFRESLKLAWGQWERAAAGVRAVCGDAGHSPSGVQIQPSTE